MTITTPQENTWCSPRSIPHQHSRGQNTIGTQQERARCHGSWRQPRFQEQYRQRCLLPSGTKGQLRTQIHFRDA